jgi:hypothetical protein
LPLAEFDGKKNALQAANINNGGLIRKIEQTPEQSKYPGTPCFDKIA